MSRIAGVQLPRFVEDIEEPGQSCWVSKPNHTVMALVMALCVMLGALKYDVASTGHEHTSCAQLLFRLSTMNCNWRTCRKTPDHA